MGAPEAIYKSADTLIEWDQLTREDTGAYLSDATMTFTLKTFAGVNVSGAVSVSMTYVTGSNGKYQGTLESTVSLSVGDLYWLEITATRGGLVGFRRILCQAQYRGSY